MIEYKKCAKFESLTELIEAIDIGLDIEFILYGRRYNISWRDERPFICECPNGNAMFYSDALALVNECNICGLPLKKIWKDIEIISM